MKYKTLPRLCADALLVLGGLAGVFAWLFGSLPLWSLGFGEVSLGTAVHLFLRSRRTTDL